MPAEEEPAYLSARHRKSLWNAYRVFPDRVELEARLFWTTFIIPLGEVVSIEVYPPPVIRTKFWALKLDGADFREHVGVQRRRGFMKHLRFTPENPEEFVAVVKRLAAAGGTSSSRTPGAPEP